MWLVKHKNRQLGGGFKHLLFSPLFGEMIQIDLRIFFRWAVTKTLVNCCIGGIILPSYMGIVISHYKDPYWTTSIMECQQGFERCSDGRFNHQLVVFLDVSLKLSRVFELSNQFLYKQDSSTWDLTFDPQFQRKVSKKLVHWEMEFDWKRRPNSVNYKHLNYHHFFRDEEQWFVFNPFFFSRRWCNLTATSGKNIWHLASTEAFFRRRISRLVVVIAASENVWRTQPRTFKNL